MNAEETTPRLTILMPCLNEAETLAACIKKAHQGLASVNLSGEILIADNGSTDGSIELAEFLGARVVHVREKGYGAALRAGIREAQGDWIIMGDSDDSYDFSAISAFVGKLQQGYDLVMGCRMPRGGGTILPGAMPWKHRWIGNPVLSFIGRLFFKCPAQDFHCGLRGFTKKAAVKMNLQTSGMEFASEMVIKANLQKMKIAEVPITLHPDGRSRPPHLRSWRDGWRHLRFMLIYSPRWLFLIPGVVLTLFSLLMTIWLIAGDQWVFGITLGVHTLLYSCAGLLIGFQMILFAFLTKTFAITSGLLPEDLRFQNLFRYFNLEAGLIVGVLAMSAGVATGAGATFLWGQTGFNELNPVFMVRTIAPSATLMILGAQIILFSFFFSVLGLKTSQTTNQG